MRTKTTHVLGVLSAAFLVLALSGCLFIGDNFTFDVDEPNQTFTIGNLTNPCNNENVNISGTINLTTDDIYSYAKLHGTGEGDQMNKYIFNTNLALLYGNPETVSIEVISKGKAPNFLLKIQTHWEGDEIIIDRAEAVCPNKPHSVIPLITPTPPIPP